MKTHEANISGPSRPAVVAVYAFNALGLLGLALAFYLGAAA